MKFEVFLSFRGPDTRNTFTSCLYSDMVEKGIRVFKDDEEVRVGQKISGQLLRALDDTQIYIPIFSKGFASSPWCLHEVAHMVDCTSKSDGKKEILPVFFDVEPDDVKLKTNLYRDGLSKHEKKYGSLEVKRWGDALVEVPIRAGWKLERKGYGELTKLIIRELLLKLKGKNISLPDHLVETDDLKRVEKLLDVDSSDHVRFLIIHGVGGIGKSILASVIFNRLRSKFDCSSFLDDVACQGILDVQKKFLSDTLGSTSIDGIHDPNDGIDRIRRGLSNKKVLVVVDNVDKKRQLDKLAGRCDWFGSGSRIIITVRDKNTMLDKDYHILPNNYLAYPMLEMPIDRAIQLFSRHAFRSDTPPEGCYNFSKEVVSSIGRLPLTLEVVGSRFANTVRSEWDETLEDLKQVPHRCVRNTLMMSIKKLDDIEKAMFLDIACFCIGEDKTYADYMWRSSGYSPRSTIDVLLLMSLIKIDEFNRFWMHDEVRDLGRYIVKEENFEDAGERRWVRIDENTLDIQSSNKEKRAVRALSLGISYELTAKELAYLPMLRFLGGERLNLVGDFKNLLCNLRWFSWRHCPLDFSATNLQLVNLVVLNLSGSMITYDWGGWRPIKMAKKLKILDLTQCSELTKTPDFSEFDKLEKLILVRCVNLSTIDSSIGKLKLLNTLNIKGCESLEGLPEEIGSLECLLEIIMPHFGKLSKLPETLGNLKYLTKFEIPFHHHIIQLPHSIGKLESLIQLDLRASGIFVLPDSIGRLKNLKHLLLSQCKDLHGLPDSIGELESLVELDLKFSRICVLPDSIGRLTNLKHLLLSECKNLQELPVSIGELESLVELDLKLSGISILLDSIGNLKRLKVLKMSFTKIRTIPCALGGLETLEELDASFCPCLKDEIPWEMWCLTRLRMLDLDGSPISMVPRKIRGFSSLHTLRIASHRLCPLPELPSSLKCLVVEAAQFPALPSSIVDSHDLKVYKEQCITLSLKPYPILQLPDFSNFQSLSVISISGCLTPRVPNLSRLKRLQELRLHEFPKLEEIPGLGELESLKFLQIIDCSVIEQLSDLSKLKKLMHLELLFCRKLRVVEGLKELNSLKNVKIIDCMSLERLPDVPTFTKLDTDWRLRRKATKLTIQSTVLGKQMRHWKLRNLK
ncbi:disease resistance protein RPV1 [Eucalyptus grandis]|uniref:disease resistance protein RPV1 n=1 Tax=Eucalyptus grandis TaxID=71139 RepID=UPI00192ED7EB|nr:disease resistance protein RPV1 [Eucalyptus grandis]